jgi:hypothetical protein
MLESYRRIEIRMMFLLDVLFGFYLVSMFLAGRYFERFVWLFPLALAGGFMKVMMDAHELKNSQNWVGDGPGYFDDFIWPFMAITHAFFLLLIGLLGLFFRKRALKRK